MNGTPDILERRVAQHANDAEVRIDLDVAKVGGEAAFGARRVELLAGSDGATGGAGLRGDLAAGGTQRLSPRR